MGPATCAPHPFFSGLVLCLRVQHVYFGLFHPISIFSYLALFSLLVFFDPIGCVRRQFFSSFPFPLHGTCTLIAHLMVRLARTPLPKTSMASDNEPTWSRKQCTTIPPSLMIQYNLPLWEMLIPPIIPFWGGSLFFYIPSLYTPPKSHINQHM